MKKYNQYTAMMAVASASFRSITRSPSAVVFTLLFPLIFIIVFGFIGGNGINLDLGLLSSAQTNNEVFHKLLELPGINIVPDKTDEELYSALEKGDLAAVVNITINPDKSGPQYLLHIQTSAASSDKGAVLKSVMENLTNKINIEGLQNKNRKVELHATEVQGRKYTMIDFIFARSVRVCNFKHRSIRYSICVF